MGDANIPLSAFDETDNGAVEPRRYRKVFLCQITGVSERPDPASKPKQVFPCFVMPVGVHWTHDAM